MRMIDVVSPCPVIPMPCGKGVKSETYKVFNINEVEHIAHFEAKIPQATFPTPSRKTSEVCKAWKSNYNRYGGTTIQKGNKSILRAGCGEGTRKEQGSSDIGRCCRDLLNRITHREDIRNRSRGLKKHLTCGFQTSGIMLRMRFNTPLCTLQGVHGQSNEMGM
jgi:hypothetical protein